VADRTALIQALAQLPPRQRAAIVLRFYDDLTEAQTAAVLGCSVSTVKSQSRAALDRLRVHAPDLLGSLTEETRS
jgi:RNA polymerase sigma factor (sigma-70 family)